MKRFLPLVLILSALTVSAQYGQPWVRPVPVKPGAPSIRPLPQAPGKQLLMKKLDSLPNGNLVYQLPQDHMPCLVPDLRMFNMPVLRPLVPSTMPNAARPGWKPPVGVPGNPGDSSSATWYDRLQGQ